MATRRSGSFSEKIRPRYRADVEKTVVSHNCERRGWISTEGDDWNVYWASVTNLKTVFSSETGFRLNDRQLVNHFPNHVELSRKDLMVKNLKRYRKELEKDPTIPREMLDFIPTTYALPSDLALFAEEFRRNPNHMWIVKPAGRAQGKGIFIVNRLSHVKRWCALAAAQAPNLKETYIISRYIGNPLLIGGKKFDLRLYVLVTSYRPLKVYVYQEGFARFSTAKYSSDVRDMNNPFVHLTNVAVQKHAEEYNASHGGKWRIRNLRLYLEATKGKALTDQLFERIENIIIHSLKAVQNVMINDRHSFECYGYDIIIDEALKPWIVEVNSSPSLSYTTHNDKLLKVMLVRDVLDIVVPDDSEIDVRRRTPSGTPKQTNLFQLLLDETAQRQDTSRSSKSGTMRWR